MLNTPGIGGAYPQNSYNWAAPPFSRGSGGAAAAKVSHLRKEAQRIEQKRQDSLRDANVKQMDLVKLQAQTERAAANAAETAARRASMTAKVALETAVAASTRSRK